jgi:hypothetical protein
MGLGLDRRFCWGFEVFGLENDGFSRFACGFTPASGRAECRFAAVF